MLHCSEMKQYHLHLGSLAVTSQPQLVQHPASSSKGWAEVVSACLCYRLIMQQDLCRKAFPGFCQWPVLVTPGYCIYINVKFFQVYLQYSFVPSVACSALCCKGSCCGDVYFLQLLLSFAAFLLCWSPFLCCIGSSWSYCGSCPDSDVGL